MKLLQVQSSARCSNIKLDWSTKYDLCVHGRRYIIPRVVFCAEFKSGMFFQAYQVFELNIFSKNHKSYDRRVSKIFFKRKKIQDLDAFLNAASINCFILDILYSS